MRIRERLCKSRAGLVRHESLLHQRVEGRVRFGCEDCGLEVAMKGALVSHRITCGEGGRLEDGQRECGRCGACASYTNFAHHVQSCREEGAATEGGGREVLMGVGLMATGGGGGVVAGDK